VRSAGRVRSSACSSTEPARTTDVRHAGDNGMGCGRAPHELERRLRERLDALGPVPRAALLHVLMLPDFERADRIGEFWATRRAGPSPSR
jgi:hypothetical protein